MLPEEQGYFLPFFLLFLSFFLSFFFAMVASLPHGQAHRGADDHSQQNIDRYGNRSLTSATLGDVNEGPSLKRLDRAVEALRLIPEPLERLDAVRIARERLEALEADAVRDARAAGVTWKAIGGLYGLSKQGAQQRFRDVPPVGE